MEGPLHVGPHKQAWWWWRVRPGGGWWWWGEAWRDLGGSSFKGFHESGPFVRGSPIVAVDRRILLLLLRTDFVVSDH